MLAEPGRDGRRPIRPVHQAVSAELCTRWRFKVTGHRVNGWPTRKVGTAAAHYSPELDRGREVLNSRAGPRRTGGTICPERWYFLGGRCSLRCGDIVMRAGCSLLTLVSPYALCVISAFRVIWYYARNEFCF